MSITEELKTMNYFIRQGIVKLCNYVLLSLTKEIQMYLYKNLIIQIIIFSSLFALLFSCSDPATPNFQRPPVGEDITITVAEEKDTSVNIIATDEDGDQLTWSIIGSLQNGSVNQASGNISADTVEFTYTSKNLLNNANDVFQIDISDQIYSDTITCTITIQADNDVPIIDQTPSINAVEDYTNAYSINIAGHDPESSAVRWYVNELPNKGAVDKLEGSITAGIEILYTLKSDSCGKDSLTFFLLDAENNSSDTAVVTITIDSVNDVPVITGQSGAVSCDEDNILTLQAGYLYVTDIDNNINDLSVIPGSGANYTVIPVSTIRPDTNYSGALTIPVRVSDGKDTSDAFDMSITVNAVNDTPSIEITNFTPNIQFGDSAEIVTEFSDVEENIGEISIFVNSILTYSGDVTGTNSYAYNWNPLFGPNILRQHAVTAVISDTEGATDTSETVMITILGSYKSDSLSVRAILDSNGLQDSTVESVSGSSGERIDTLEFMGAEYTKISSEIGNLDQLKRFSIANAGIKRLPPEIAGLKSLENLQIVYTALEEMPPYIGELVNLKSINFYSVNIQTLPAEFGNLDNLTSLSFEYCGLIELPPEIGDLEKIESFNVSFGQLGSVPPEIGQLLTLNRLILSQNTLQSLPNEICNLANLKTLRLGFNNLTDLPANISQLENVMVNELDLQQNKLYEQNPPWKEWADLRDPDWATTQSKK